MIMRVNKFLVQATTEVLKLKIVRKLTVMMMKRMLMVMMKEKAAKLMIIVVKVVLGLLNLKRTITLKSIKTYSLKMRKY